MTSSALAKIEDQFGIKLPAYYKEVLLNYPESLMETGGPDFELTIDVEKLIEENKCAYHDLWGAPLHQSYFVVGENGCGDYFLINLEKDEGVVAFEHETDSFYRLSNTLLEYVDLIPEGKYEKNFGKKEFLLKDLRMKG